MDYIGLMDVLKKIEEIEEGAVEKEVDRMEKAAVFDEKPVVVVDTADAITLCCDELCDILLRKNSNYGNSALTAPALCPTLSAYDGLMVRLGDKFSRLKQLNSGNQDLVGESVRDTITDIAGYCILAMIELDKANFVPTDEDDEDDDEYEEDDDTL